MEKFDYSKNDQRNIEKRVLLIYVLYNIYLLAMSIKWDLDNWIRIGLIVGPMLGWIVYIGRYRNYQFRAAFTTALMQGSILLYITHVANFPVALPFSVAMVVFAGLYGLPEILYITVVSTLLQFMYCGTAADSQIMQEGHIAGAYFFWQLANILFVEYVVYHLVKRQRESSVRMLEIIDALKAAEHSKDDFLANVSHELRTPINTICGMSEVALREDDIEKAKEEIYNIQTAGRNLMSVVRDILDFSELQAGKMEIEEEAYNIASTINDIINMAVAKKGEKPIELIVDCDADFPCALLGDEKKIRRVIMNIVDNAIKFTSEGCVSIEFSHRREAYGINLIVTVRDTGIGMESESLEKLFTSFNQAEAKKNRKESGVGLGLAIVQAIVQKMDGTVTVRSYVGKGSVLRVVIPQKVLDENPIVHIDNREQLNVGVYIDMEQFERSEIRDEYSKNISHMVEKLNTRNHVCRNLSELKRRQMREHFTHIFISLVEYREDPEYFDELSQYVRVIAIIDHSEEKYITNPAILRVYKPFYVLPIVAALNGIVDEAAEQYPVRTEKFRTRNVDVLVVDDNLMNIKVMEGLLKNYDIQVSMASSGQEALEKIETQQYDFVFMDHMMPEMDGIETLHCIRRKVGTYYQKVPVIALTANAVAGTREMFIKEGFSDFLEKPVEISVLERVLRRNLPKEKIISIKDGEKKEGKIVVGDLDVQKGIVYCGGIEKYKTILGIYSQNGEEDLRHLEELYEKQDWKNYTIAIHAVKSSMLSIGALPLSEMAKKLEFAGREGDIAYIRMHQEGMKREYARVIGQIREGLTAFSEKEDQREEEEKLPVLTTEEFDQLVLRLEDAMYALDGAGMQETVEELKKYAYRGKALSQYLNDVERKIEMSDYMSAVETVLQMKDRLSKEQEGEGICEND